MSYFAKILQAARPQTLVAVLCPVMLAAAFAKYKSSYFHWNIILLAFCAAAMIQIATNFLNDALDADAGRDTENRLGPQRFSSLDPGFKRTLKNLSYLLLFFAGLIGTYFIYLAGWPVFLLGVPALFLAYLYTGTRFSLSANGVADLFVVAYFGFIPLGLLEYLLFKEWSWESWVLGFQIGLLCNVLLVINNIRDQKEDQETSKKTLVVRLGRRGGLGLLAFCLFTPYFLNVLWLGTSFFRAAYWTFGILPLAFYIFVQVLKTEPSKKYNKFLAFSALHLLLFSLVFFMGILSS